MNNRLLILTTTYPLDEDNTIPTFVHHLAVGFRNRKFKVQVLTPNYPGGKVDTIMDGVNVKRFYFMRPRKKQTLCINGGILTNIKRNKIFIIQALLMSIVFLRKAIKRTKNLKPDLVNSHWIIPGGLIGSRLARKFKIEHYATLHAADVYMLAKLPFKKILAKYIMRGCTKIFPVSQHVKNIFLTLFNEKYQTIAESKIKVVSMGVWSKDMKIEESKEDLRAKYDYKTKQFLIMFLGRLVEKKGIPYLIDAMKRVSNQKPESNLKLVICGDGPDKDELMKYVKNLQLGDIIEFKGAITEKQKKELMNLVDVVAVPSIVTQEGDTEGLPVVILEAKACGKPVIASNVGGICDAIKHENNGYLVNQKEPIEIADHIVKLMNDPELLEKLGEKSLESAKIYDWKNIVDKYLT